ncbi:MAG: orotate phosphoribosyltransferase [Candidatus Micrarchaeota archaeon]
MEKRELALLLHTVGAIKFGEFTLKSGSKSPVYIDLRILISAPETLRKVAISLNQAAHDISFDRLCGIPYAALPIGVAMSLESGVPLVYARKETKAYGTNKPIEGVHKAGETVLMVDDVITNADSKFEAAKPLQDAGLIIRDFLVLVDREQGGRDKLEKAGYKLHALFTMTELTDFLLDGRAIDSEMRDKVLAYILENQVI